MRSVAKAPCPVSLGGGGAMSVPPATLSSRGVNFTSGVLRYKLRETLTEVTKRVGGASTHLAGQRDGEREKDRWRGIGRWKNRQRGTEKEREALEKNKQEHQYISVKKKSKMREKAEDKKKLSK